MSTIEGLQRCKIINSDTLCYFSTMTESFKFSTKRTVLLLFWLAIWNLEAAALSQQDIQTLKAFYDATGGPGWKFGTGCSTDVIALKERARAVFIPNSVPWDFSSSAGDPCDGQKPWFGVTCSAARDAIVGINLQSYGLRTLDGGGVPSSIGQLSSLTFLNLGDNCVSGPIPAELLGMQSLEDLMLPIWIMPTSEVLTKGSVPPSNNALFCGAELPAPTSASSPKRRNLVIAVP